MLCKIKRKFYVMYILAHSIKKITVVQKRSASIVMTVLCRMNVMKQNVLPSNATVISSKKQSSDCFLFRLYLYVMKKL